MRARSAIAPLMAVLGALLALACMLLLLGHDPWAATLALVDGAFGNRHAVETTLLRTGPLLLIGLAVALSFRAGIWNIGGEGQLYIGALVATTVATKLTSVLPLVLIAGMLGGALWSGLAALLRAHRGVSEVLSTILLNFIAVLLVSYAVQGPLQEVRGTYPQTDALPSAAMLGVIPGFQRVHWGLAGTLVLALFAWRFLFYSAAGLRLRAIGFAPRVAEYARVRISREIYQVFILAGMLAGLAGALEVTGVTGRLFRDLSAGYGFTAIAVAMLARLHPLAVVPAALFFAGLDTGAAAMQRVAAVPAVTVRIVEALVILFSIGFALPRRKA